MRIIIICGSLEPGKDGVGDYSRRLASQMAKFGHQVKLLALNDKVITTNEESVQIIEGISLSCLRLGIGLKEKLKVEYSIKWISSFQPDVLSLQYVPFSFHPKGIHIGLGKLLQAIGNGNRWHFMFHELWVGLPRASNIKIKLWGSIQELMIGNLVKKLKPIAITTTIPFYQQKLKAYKPILLPLFGNIPKVYNDLTCIVRNEIFQVTHFGSVSHFQEDFRKQVKWIKHFCDSRNLSAKIVFAGEMGGSKDSAVEIAQELLGKDSVEIKGWIEENDLSKLFASSHLGLSRADTVFYGKSGSTIAMLEHGLPILLRDLNILQIPFGVSDEIVVTPLHDFEMTRTKGVNRLISTTTSFLKIISDRLRVT